MTRAMFVALIVAATLAAPAVARAEINIGISVSPPPAVVVTSPPPIVAIPESPVLYAPSATFNLFVYSGRYYSFHNGSWFVTAGPNGAWAIIAPERVPAPVLEVPRTYYRVPPGHMQRMDDDEPHGHRGCPPGLAKQGRC